MTHHLPTECDETGQTIVCPTRTVSTNGPASSTTNTYRTLWKLWKIPREAATVSLGENASQYSNADEKVNLDEPVRPLPISLKSGLLRVKVPLHLILCTRGLREIWAPLTAPHPCCVPSPHPSAVHTVLSQLFHSDNAERETLVSFSEGYDAFMSY